MNSARQIAARIQGRRCHFRHFSLKAEEKTAKPEIKPTKGKE
jgi:hypothetical protein